MEDRHPRKLLIVLLAVFSILLIARFGPRPLLQASTGSSAKVKPTGWLSPARAAGNGPSRDDLSETRAMKPR